MTTSAAKATADCYMYLRQSQDPNQTEEAINRQRPAAQEAADRRGLNVLRVFVDNDTSATKRNVVRKDFQAMLAAMREGHVRTILFQRIDRLLRTHKDLLQLTELAADLGGIELVPAEGSAWDLKTAAGIGAAQFATTVSEMEGRIKAERQRNANRDRAVRGQASKMNRTFGYNRDGSVNPAEAALVVQVFEKFAAGSAISTLAKWLGDQAGRTWSHGGMRHLLVNRRYIGEITYRGECLSTGGTPLVPAELFEAAQELIANRRMADSRLAPSRKHLGSGVYRCGVCGEPMVMGGGRPVGGRRKTACPYLYRCPVKGHVTRAGQIIDQWVTEAVVARLSDDKVRAQFATHRDAGQSVQLQAQAAKLRQQKSLLADLALDGTLDRNQVRAKNSALDADLVTVNRALAELGRSSALAEILGHEDPAAAWLDHPDIWARVRVLDELVDVVVHKIGVGHKPTPASVTVTLKNA